MLEEFELCEVYNIHVGDHEVRYEFNNRLFMSCVYGIPVKNDGLVFTIKAERDHSKNKTAQPQYSINIIDCAVGKGIGKKVI